jgi:hypothetical protein
MCGGCGGAPLDPFGALVAGPSRRAAVARAVGRATPSLTVRAVPGAWTVAHPTGRTTVCRTLEALLDAVAAHAAPSRRAVRDAALRAAEVPAAEVGDTLADSH